MHQKIIEKPLTKKIFNLKFLILSGIMVIVEGLCHLLDDIFLPMIYSKTFSMIEVVVFFASMVTYLNAESISGLL